MMSSGYFKYTTDHAPSKQFSLHSVYMSVSSGKRTEFFLRNIFFCFIEHFKRPMVIKVFPSNMPFNLSYPQHPKSM